MSRLRIGVVGLGIGRTHILGYDKHPAASVVAVCDLDRDLVERVAAEFRVPGKHSDYRSMLETERLDVVSVATPNFLHRPMAVAALEAGCHVLCEKPPGLDASDAAQMLDAARKAGRRLMYNFSYRFREPARALKRQIDAGALGQVYFARSVWHRRRGVPGLGTWFTQRSRAGGGPLVDLGVHRLDLALWLMGYPQPTWVLGTTHEELGKRLAAVKGAAFDVEDLAAAFVRFDNGASLVIEASWAAEIAEAELMETRLLGTKGGLVQRNVHGLYELEAALYSERDGVLTDTHFRPPFPDTENAMQHFVTSIVNGTQHMATAEEGVALQSILDAVYASARDGAPARLG